MRIQRLDEITINQIAAGEVVENSASVVKELVENSLDAGATQIQVELLAGGRQLLRVSDNGCGMTAAEVLVALERHATSKLRAVDDLDELLSFGFRGEAIPSIASISRLRILSAQEGEDGFGVKLEAGQILERGPVARERGTTVEVRDLFFNVPARLKFQKSPSADLAACTRVLKQLALAHPNVWFQLRVGSEGVFEALPSDETIAGLQQRCQGIFGADWKHARGMTLEEGQLRLKILLQPPHAHRPNRNDQFVMLNRRVVQCPAVGMAIREAMAHRLDPGRYPAFLAAVDLPPSWVDVNVHPQKREVRLRQEALLRGTIARATHCLLANWTLEPESCAPASTPSPAIQACSAVSSARPSSSPSGEAIWMAWHERTEERLAQEQRQLMEPRSHERDVGSQADRDPPRCSDEGLQPVAMGNAAAWDRTSAPVGPAEPRVFEPASADAPVSTTGLFSIPTELIRIGHYRLLMASEEGFWASQGHGVWLVDEGALRKAYLQELFSARLRTHSQPLLLPQRVMVGSEECERLGCRAVGFDWREAGEGLVLTAIPACLDPGEAADLLVDWVSCQGLSRSFWKRCAGKSMQAVSLHTLLAFQAEAALEEGPLGEPLRAWVSEMGLATYLAGHGFHHSSLTPSGPAQHS